MAGSITHPFVSAKTDGADATKVRPVDWNVAHTFSGFVEDSDFTAYTILMATVSATPIALTVDVQTLVGRKTGGAIAALSGADALLAMGITPLVAELNYVDGVTSAIQTQIDLKSPIASPTFTGVVTIPTPFTLGAVSVTATGTQLNYLAGATGTTGTATTSLVFSTSPTLVTPTLGVASATSLATSAAIPLLLTYGQLVNISLASQTVGATTLTIPDFASVADTFVFITLSQTLVNKTLTSPTINGTIGTTGLTLPAITLGGAVTGGDQAFTNVGDMTFAAGSILASGSTNGNTLLIRANDTTFVTLTTGATDVCTINAPTMSGTWLASGTVTIPAVTLGGTITGGSQTITGLGYLYVTGAAAQTSLGNFRNYEDPWVDTDNTSRAGIKGIVGMHKTSAAYTGQLIGLQYQANVMPSNTQNWTNVMGLIGADISVLSRAGSTGIVTAATALRLSLNFGAASCITGYGLYVMNDTASGETNLFGIFVEDLTGGSTLDVGIAIAGADTVCLWVGSGADNTDTQNGIMFGASRDTDLYRSAANTLKTDDAFICGALTIYGTLTCAANYIQLTEMAAPGAGAADTARIYAIVGGDTLTDLAAVFQDGTVDIFAQEATDPDSPIFQFPSMTDLKLQLRKPDRKTVQFAAIFPDGREFIMKELRYPSPRWN